MRIQRNKEKKRLEAEGNGEKVLEDSTSEVDTSSSEQGDDDDSSSFKQGDNNRCTICGKRKQQQNDGVSLD